MSIADELHKLQQLRDSGAIDEVEFATAKERVLNGDASQRPETDWATETVPLTGVALEQQTRRWSAILHLSILTGYLAVPLVGLVAPIVIWQLKKDELPGLDVHGRNAADWILSSLIYVVVSIVLCVVLIGFPLLLALGVCSIIFPILAAVKANNGEIRKYPYVIEFFKE